MCILNILQRTTTTMKQYTRFEWREIKTNTFYTVQLSKNSKSAYTSLHTSRHTKKNVPNNIQYNKTRWMCIYGYDAAIITFGNFVFVHDVLSDETASNVWQCKWKRDVNSAHTHEKVRFVIRCRAILKIILLFDAFFLLSLQCKQMCHILCLQ